MLGNLGDVGLEILSIIKQNDLPLTFPEEVLDASYKVPKTIKRVRLNGRRDLRDRTVVTVDGEDAKDLDDAVYVKKLNSNGISLGRLYLPMSAIMLPKTVFLDREAHVPVVLVCTWWTVFLPTLPERLSNGIL